jgi:zinc protease
VIGSLLARSFPFAAKAVMAAVTVATFAMPATATEVERVISPRGIEAWFVRQTTLPLIAIDFAFSGGSAQDPAGKSGLANMMVSLLDEGAGDIDSRTFHERVERRAIGINFAASRDQITGSLRTLVENKDEAFDLLRLALTSPRFDSDAVERVRGQIMSALRRSSTNPNDIASRRWWEMAFPDHPYAWPVNGTMETLPTITAGDLKAQSQRVLARDTLKIGIVGNIDAATAGVIVDRIFGDLPAKAELTPVPAVEPKGLGTKVTVELDVAQSVVLLGGVGPARNDPDFMPAFVLNHILGGGPMSSRLYTEVREVRGLAYSVYSTLAPLKATALFMSGTGTRGDRAAQALDVMEQEFRRMAEHGPTAQEFEDAKSYLKGSFALRFDTSSKIAGQLVQLQMDNLGIDYIIKRNGLIDAVTLDEVKRVAKRILGGKMLVAVVGRAPMASAPESGGTATHGTPAKRESGG